VTLTLLLVIGGFQLLFCLALVLLLLLGKQHRGRRSRSRGRAGDGGGEPWRAWLVTGGPAAPLVEALRALPHEDALDYAASLVTQQLPAGRHAELAAALGGEPWMRRALGRAGSRIWWRRLDAARALSVVGGPADTALLLRLIDDPLPAVQAVATRSIPHVADAATVRYVVDRLPRRTHVVRVSQYRALRDVWALATPALLDRLSPASTATPDRLAVWVALAGALEVPACVAACVPLAQHADARVRIAVARVLKSYYHPAAESALRTLLGDADWRVRGQAARSLGALRAAAAVPALVAAMRDQSWWVRFRAGLSLTQIGEPGRQALRELRLTSDRYGVDMATMISGLSDGGVTELAEL
jgi:HEAT repeat protein